jgi:acyl dehydratase
VKPLSLAEVRAGAELEPLRKDPVTRDQLRAYADASGDHNPIHLDDHAAREQGLDGVIAHGMLSMGFLGQYAARLAGEEGFVEELFVRFGRMVAPGDVLTCRGTVDEVTPAADGRGRVRVSLWAENELGERPTAGGGVLNLPERR